MTIATQHPVNRRATRPLSVNARKVISKRYAAKDPQGRPVEEWTDIVKRVVDHVSNPETDPTKREQFHRAAIDIMLNREFIPNTPCIVNAGRQAGQLAACFVLGVPDSLAGIMDHARTIALIHQTGGGTGMTYEFLRPHGANVSSAIGVASGPVSPANVTQLAPMHTKHEPPSTGPKLLAVLSATVHLNTHLAATSVATVDIPGANKAATKMRSPNSHLNSEYLSFET